MSLIDKVLSREEFKDRPPVLLDIGASGMIHKKWKRIAKYSICIAFDADARDFNPTPEIAKKYQKLFLLNAIVTDRPSDYVDFYLTKSPYCSSLLKPSTEKLSQWSFAPLFEVEKKVQLRSVDINSVLKESNIDRIDWFKSDSQGTDLRLFKSLEPSIRNKTIVAEFEPGIMDAYEGEDKLHSVLSFMDSIDQFWLADLIINGVSRISHSRLKNIIANSFIQNVASRVSKVSPGWGEMTYINSFNNLSVMSKREILFGWVCATLQRHYGFAYELACIGLENYDDSIFNLLKSDSETKFKLSLVSTKYSSLFLKKISERD